MVSIRISTLITFWIRKLGTVRGNLSVVKKMRKSAREELGLEQWLPLLGPYPLKDEVGISLDCTTMRF